MENASRGLAQVVRQKLSDLKGSRVAIVAGAGNNAGDGFAVARHLHNARCDPVVLIVGQESRISGDARTNLEIIKRMRLDVRTLSQDQQGLDELRRDLRDDGVAVPAQSSHSGGNPMSQRG